MLRIHPLVCMVGWRQRCSNSPSFPGSTSFALWFWSSSLWWVESIFSSLGSELALWLTLANTMWWKWGYAGSELRPWEPLQGPLEPLCCCVNRHVTDNMLVPGMAAMTVNSQTTTRYVSDTISNQPFLSRLQVTTDRWLSPAKFSRAWPRWAELPGRHIARWVKRNAYSFSNHWVWHYFFYSND